MSLKRKRPNNLLDIDLDCASDAEKISETDRLIIPRSLWKPDFEELAQVYPEFHEAWKELKSRRSKSLQQSKKRASFQSGKSSFSTIVNHAFNVALTRALLDKHFQLCLPHLPEGYLCPPIPNRLNYVLWIQRLLKETICNDDDEKLHYRGMDLGTGVSAIYPLLFSVAQSDSSKWKLLGTDIDEKSIQFAKENVKANHLDKQIHIELVPLSFTQQQDQKSLTDNTIKEDVRTYNIRKNDLGKKHGGPIEAAMKASQKIEMFASNKHNNNHCQGKNQQQMNWEEEHIPFDFCMTNPPFYGSEAEARDPRAGDGRCRTDMTLSEGTYPGGEVGFVIDMIRDSFYYGKVITWYSSMVGKKSTLVTIEKQLKTFGFGKANIRTTEFIQGMTRRWGIAWTFNSVTIKSNDTVCHPGNLEFEVKLGKMMVFDDALKEVVSRIQTHCDNFKNITVQLLKKMSENTLPQWTLIIVPNGNSSKDDLNNINLPHPVPELPVEGDFLVNIILSPKVLCDDVQKDCNDTFVIVKVSCFSHSKAGTSIASKICCQLQGEICRCSRKWRRLLKNP